MTWPDVATLLIVCLTGIFVTAVIKGGKRDR